MLFSLAVWTTNCFLENKRKCYNLFRRIRSLPGGMTWNSWWVTFCAFLHEGSLLGTLFTILHALFWLNTLYLLGRLGKHVKSSLSTTDVTWIESPLGTGPLSIEPIQESLEPSLDTNLPEALSTELLVSFSTRFRTSCWPWYPPLIVNRVDVSRTEGVGLMDAPSRCFTLISFPS